MDLETREKQGGTEITVKADSEVALVVYSNGEERIYLPVDHGSDDTYYVEEPEKLLRTENGYRVLHHGKVDDIEVLRSN